MKLKPGAKFKARKPRRMHPDAVTCLQPGFCEYFWDGRHRRRVLRVTREKTPRAKQCWTCQGWCSLSPVIRGKEAVVACMSPNFTLSADLVESGVLDDELDFASGLNLPRNT